MGTDRWVIKPDESVENGRDGRSVPPPPCQWRYAGGVEAAIERRLDRWFHRRPQIAKLIRYSSASVAGFLTTQVVLLATLTVLGMDAVVANLIGVTAGAVPNYLINRAWTWSKTDRHSLVREVLPFWAMTLAGLGLSTVFVAWADNRFDGAYWAVSGGNVSAFALLWVAKYFMLERVLFRPAHPAD
jgi:putative flippase GtrA